MKKLNEIETTKELVDEILSSLQITKKQLAAALNCTQVQLNNRAKNKPGKTIKLERELLVIYNIIILNQGAGAGELRSLVEEAFNGKGTRQVSFKD